MRPIAILRTLAAPLLGHLGSAVLRASVAESDRADAAELNEARAQGAFEASKHYSEYLLAELTESREAAWEAGKRALRLESEVETLRSELSSAAADDEHYPFVREALANMTVERDDLVADVNKARARIRELEDQCGTMADAHVKITAERGRAFEIALESKKEAAAEKMARKSAEDQLAASKADAADMRKTLRESEGRERCGSCQMCAKCGTEIVEVDIAVPAFVHVDCPKVAPVPTCDWCLTKLSEPLPGGETLNLCDFCMDDESFGWDNVRARVATRAVSCVSRRTSADPLTIRCPVCEAPIGVLCEGTEQ